MGRAVVCYVQGHMELHAMSGFGATTMPIMGRDDRRVIDMRSRRSRVANAGASPAHFFAVSAGPTSGGVGSVSVSYGYVSIGGRLNPTRVPSSGATASVNVTGDGFICLRVLRASPYTHELVFQGSVPNTISTTYHYWILAEVTVSGSGTVSVGKQSPGNKEVNATV